MTKVKLYAHPECWLFRKNNPEEFKSFGCGPGGAGDKLVPDTMYGLDVSNACRIHDWYYRFYPENTKDYKPYPSLFAEKKMLSLLSDGSQVWSIKLF